MKLSEIARQTGDSPATMRRLAAAGRIHGLAQCTAGGHYRVRDCDKARAWIQKRIKDRESRGARKRNSRRDRRGPGLDLVEGIVNRFALWERNIFPTLDLNPEIVSRIQVEVVAPLEATLKLLKKRLSTLSKTNSPP